MSLRQSAINHILDRVFRHHTIGDSECSIKLNDFVRQYRIYDINNEVRVPLSKIIMREKHTGNYYKFVEITQEKYDGDPNEWLYIAWDIMPHLKN